jgi:hypothetical protein
MAESTPYTKLRQSQYRGPSTSEDYNARIAENYRDLVILYNQVRLLDADVDEFYRTAASDQLGLARLLTDLESRVTTLEGASKRLTFGSDAQLDNARFASSPFAVGPAERCFLDTGHGVLLLPRVDSSSLSKLFFTNNDGVDVLSPTLETRVLADVTTADGPSAFIDSSAPELAVLRRPGRIWERNVVVDTTNPNGAALTFYVKTPTDLFTTDKSNVIVLHPYPAFSTDLIEVAYTTMVDPLMQDGDGYTVLNSNGWHNGTPAAIGWLPPGGFPGDTILNSGPKAFFFDPLAVTGLRIKLKSRNPHPDSGKQVYSYGLSSLDLRFDKFLTSGRAMLRFDAPSAQTISSVTSIQPQIWNVAPAAWPNVFSTRVIWETALNSGVYTLTPVPLSKKVWIEVTLNMTDGKGSPALSGLTLTYS